MCIRDSVCIGTTKSSVWNRVGEYSRCCILRLPEKSAVAEQALYNSDYRVLFEETKVLSSVRYCYPYLDTDSVEIYKDPGQPMYRRGEIREMAWCTERS